ncbi:dienelactone hydrolase family protein [Rhodoferax sp.]|uniref:dienelactone hydrolase family protein n=1 Tax=Rhodoferax sp. TaxID=50421 RepID=UPI00374CBEFE
MHIPLALKRLFLFSICAGLQAANAAPAQEVHFNSLDGTPLRAWLLQPDAPANARIPTVIALHGCGGLYARGGAADGKLNERHQAMAEMLLQEGYAVLWPDSLTPRGVDQLCTQKIGQRSITQAERRRDALAALAWVAAQPWARPNAIALMGWSHGGSAVLAATDARQSEVAAQRQKFAAAIAFYPGCGAASKDGYQPNTALTLLLGEKDDWTPAAACITLGQAVGAEVHVYPDSYHDFDNPSGKVRLRRDVPNGLHPGQGVHAGRNPAAREEAYARVREELRQALGKSASK